MPIKMPGTPISFARTIDVVKLIIASATGTKRFSCKIPAADSALLIGTLMPLRKKFIAIAATASSDKNKSSPSHNLIKYGAQKNRAILIVA